MKIILALLILAMLYPSFKRLYKIVTTEGFIKAFGFFLVYLLVIRMIARIVDEDIIFVVWILAAGLYYKLCKIEPKLYLPLQFVLTIGTLGLALFFMSQKFNSGNNNNNNNQTFVNPHQVNSYTRHDGTDVNGYWRDGDGNTNIDLTREQGGGYFRSK